MRILFSSTPLAGHFGPMAPFVRASVRAGHGAMVVGPAALAAPAEAAGAAFWAVAEPDAGRMAQAFEVLRGLSHADANRWMIGEIFGRLRSEAALPGLREAIRSYRPDLVLRESAELGAAVAAEVHDLPHARVAIGVNATEELFLDLVAGPVDELRQASGLPPDPNARRLREAPVLTLFPAALDDPGLPGATSAWRFRDPVWASIPIDGGGGPRPFVYITFGTETGRMPIFETVYRAAVQAVEVLDVDVLITVGRDVDPGALGAPPPRVRVERWVDQATVLGRAAAVVCHGGGGSVVGALAAGVPLVVVPLFAEDQHINARCVAAVGAGLAVSVDAERIRSALQSVLAGRSFRAAAANIASEMNNHISLDDLPLAQLAGRGQER